jgi:hypothetical protein
MIRAYLDTVPEIGRDDVVALLGVTPVQASRILSQLFRDRGVIEPVGNVRGRGVRASRTPPIPIRARMREIVRGYAHFLAGSTRVISNVLQGWNCPPRLVPA